MDWEFAPSAINDAGRLFLDVRKDFGAEIFDNAESFDEVFGTGRFAMTESRTRDGKARRMPVREEVTEDSPPAASLRLG